MKVIVAGQPDRIARDQLEDVQRFCQCKVNIMNGISNINANMLPAQLFGRQAGINDRLIGGLQQLPRTDVQSICPLVVQTKELIIKIWQIPDSTASLG